MMKFDIHRLVLEIGEYQDEYPQIDIHASQIGAYQNFGPRLLPYYQFVICKERTGTAEVLEGIPPYLHLEPKWEPKYYIILEDLTHKMVPLLVNLPKDRSDGF